MAERGAVVAARLEEGSVKESDNGTETTDMQTDKALLLDSGNVGKTARVEKERRLVPDSYILHLPSFPPLLQNNQSANNDLTIHTHRMILKS